MRLFDIDMKILVESDFIYLPLLFDPDIEKETKILLHPERTQWNTGQQGSQTIIKHKDKYFVKAISIQSLLNNYAAINAYSFRQLEKECLKKYSLTRDVDDIFLDGVLRTILFRIMPYFVKINRGLKRQRLSDVEVLDLVGETINIPDKYYKEAEAFRNLEPLRRIFQRLKAPKPIFKSPENGMLTGRKFGDWLREAIHEKVLTSEHDRIVKALEIREQFSETRPQHIATLLFIADTGAIEIDGFGFIRNNAYKGEYYIYKRTGEYILKDYYARDYVFPDCRVAVSTYTPFRPFVMEKYKHPFLLAHKTGQEICIANFVPYNEFTAENIIRTLEEGLTAMQFGYDGRRRNGYHSLDKTWVHIPTIDFEDYRM